MKGYSLIFIITFSKKEIMMLAIVLLFTVTSLSGPLSNEAWAQTKHFWITFDKLHVNISSRLKRLLYLLWCKISS